MATVAIARIGKALPSEKVCWPKGVLLTRGDGPGGNATLGFELKKLASDCQNDGALAPQFGELAISAPGALGFATKVGVL
jgi:hypothetical protein